MVVEIGRMTTISTNIKTQNMIPTMIDNKGTQVAVTNRKTLSNTILQIHIINLIVGTMIEINMMMITMMIKIKTEVVTEEEIKEEITKTNSHIIKSRETTKTNNLIIRNQAEGTIMTINPSHHSKRVLKEENSKITIPDHRLLNSQERINLCILHSL